MGDDPRGGLLHGDGDPTIQELTQSYGLTDSTPMIGNTPIHRRRHDALSCVTSESDPDFRVTVTLDLKTNGVVCRTNGVRVPGGEDAPT